MNAFRQFLNEMVFKRAILLEKIDKQNIPLMEHALCLIGLGEILNWDKTTANIINYLTELYDIKEHRQYMKKDDLMDILFYNPYKDSDEEWIQLKLK